MMMKLFKSVFTLLILLCFSVSAQARSLDEILKSGVLKGGVNPGLPPLAKYNDKNISWHSWLSHLRPVLPQ